MPRHPDFDQAAEAEAEWFDHVVTEAADLLSEHGENPEYDRALVELTTRLLHLDDDAKPEIEAALRRLHPITTTEGNTP